MKDGRLVAIDVFSGGGGISEGLRLTGFNVCLAVESSLDAYLVYTLNHRHTPVIWESIRRMRGFGLVLHSLGFKKADIDLVAGGPPCQGFSVANKRTRNMQNGQNRLVWEFVRVVKDLQPPAFILENVPGMLGMQDGELVANLKSEFELLGYGVHEMRLDAADYGVPQHRRRLFLVGYDSGKIDEPEPLFGSHSDKPYVKVKDALLGDLPPLDGNTGSTVVQYSRPAETAYQAWSRTGSPRLHDHITTKCGPIVKARFNLIGEGQNLRDLIDQGDKIPKELEVAVGHRSVYRRLDRNEPSVTVVNFRKAMLIHPVENRLLSLREAARLQSFQDRYRFPGKISLMQQLVGDCVPPLLMKAVAEKVASRILS